MVALGNHHRRPYKEATSVDWWPLSSWQLMAAHGSFVLRLVLWGCKDQARAWATSCTAGRAVSRDEARAASAGLPHGGLWSLRCCIISSLLPCLHHPCSSACLGCCLRGSYPPSFFPLLPISYASDCSRRLVLCGICLLPSLVGVSQLCCPLLAGATSV